MGLEIADARLGAHDQRGILQAHGVRLMTSLSPSPASRKLKVNARLGAIVKHPADKERAFPRYSRSLSHTRRGDSVPS